MASVVSSARAAVYRRFLDLCQWELREVDSWHSGVGSVLCLYALKWIELECVVEGLARARQLLRESGVVLRTSKTPGSGRTHGTHGTDENCTIIYRSTRRYIV